MVEHDSGRERGKAGVGFAHNGKVGCESRGVRLVRWYSASRCSHGEVELVEGALFGPVEQAAAGFVN